MKNFEICLYLLAQCSCFRLPHFTRLRQSSEHWDLAKLCLLFWDHPLLERQIFERLKNPQAIENEFTLLEKKSIQLIYPTHSYYPLRFYALEKPPLCLFVRGKLSFHGHTLSVVGAREVSHQTLKWMDKHLFPVIETLDVLTVSGGARGVDRKAHEFAIELKKPTVVFLPSGVESIYPRDLENRIDRYLETGSAFVSEYAPPVQMQKHHFLHRNRMIASFSSHLLVMQARERGGTMMTAQWALRLGTQVAVLPQDPLNPDYSGNLQLLVDGAVPLRDQLDLRIFLERKELSVPYLVDQRV